MYELIICTVILSRYSLWSLYSEHKEKILPKHSLKEGILPNVSHWFSLCYKLALKSIDVSWNPILIWTILGLKE